MRHGERGLMQKGKKKFDNTYNCQNPVYTTKMWWIARTIRITMIT